MEFPKVTKKNNLYTIEFGDYSRYLTEVELIQLFEKIDEALPPNTIELTIFERVTAIERFIKARPCSKYAPT